MEKFYLGYDSELTEIIIKHLSGLGSQSSNAEFIINYPNDYLIFNQPLEITIIWALYKIFRGNCLSNHIITLLLQSLMVQSRKFAYAAHFIKR